MESKNIYEDLISNICKKESLIDVGRIGTASQSSTSKWSKENDAQRALSNNNFANFAFHTDKEHNPWWQVEFDKPIKVEYIIINNRKQEPFDEIASDLRIVAYDSKGIETLIHQGKVFFGSDSKGMPLVIPLKNKLSFKKLRIILLKNNYLHLSNINFLVANPLSSFGDKAVFVAQRADGLGERLRALLNSMVLAKIFDGHFIFAWPLSFSQDQFHAIEKPEDIFSSDFIESHLVTRDMLNKCNIKEINDLEKAIAHEHDGSIKIGINVSQISLEKQIKNRNLKPKNLGLEYKLAFEKIKFNESVTKAINLARTVKLKNKVLGIHLRTGDIVYGEIRNMDRWGGKVVPFYVVDKLITCYLGLGYNVILFSQDNESCKYFVDKYGVLLSSNLIPEEYDNIQRAIFDIILMSRCREIVGGSSGFSIVASWIGNSEILSYKNILTEKEIKNSFISSYSVEGVLSSSAINPLLKSFSIAHYLQNFKELTSLSERIEFFKKCIEIDHTNGFYRLLLALDHYKKNNFELADSILLEAINSTNIIWLAQKKFPKTTVLSQYTLELEKYASQGSIVAAYVAFLSRYYCDEMDMNNSFYQEFIEKSPQNTVGVELLKEIQKKLTV